MEDRSNLNQKINESLQSISELCGGANKIADTVLEFDDTKNEIFEKQREVLIRGICDLVRVSLKLPDFEQFLVQLPDTEFWDEIKEIVEKRTNGYLNAVPFNHLEKEKRMELLKKCFDYIFVERENFEFLAERLGDETLARTLYGVMIESEYAIITLYVSKRRFMLGMRESYGLIENDTEYIWNIFESNCSLVEKHEFHRRMFHMNRKLDELNDLVNDIQEDFDTLISIFDKEN